MDLSEIQKLPVEGKLEWLQSPAGLIQLSDWLSDNASLRRVAKLLSIDSKTIYRWRRSYPAVAEIIASYLPATKDTAANLARPAAYRIIVGYNHSTLRQYPKHGCNIHSEYATPQELWDSDFITNYFKPFGVSKANYFADFLRKIDDSSLYHLSNYFSIAHCDVTRKGVLRVLKGGATNA